VAGPTPAAQPARCAAAVTLGMSGHRRSARLQFDGVFRLPFPWRLRLRLKPFASFGFSAGFTGPNRSRPDRLNWPYDGLALLGVRAQPHFSTAAVSKALARSVGVNGARAGCRLPMHQLAGKVAGGQGASFGYLGHGPRAFGQESTQLSPESENLQCYFFKGAHSAPRAFRRAILREAMRRCGQSNGRPLWMSESSLRCFLASKLLCIWVAEISLAR
jgi:hypothetical protein